MNILVLNSGSSSVKFKLIHIHDEEKENEGRKEKQRVEETLKKGSIEEIGSDNSKINFCGNESEEPIKNHDEAIELIINHLDFSLIDLIAHRVVHGGNKFKKPTIITDKVIATIDELKTIAPLHNPHNLAGILACKKHAPNIQQIAIFDTAFHQTMPAHAYMYSLPKKFYEKYHIRKYGFHGISHHYITEETRKFLGKEQVNIISVHCGNGTSLCAIKENKSIETSMGFTPLEGVLMGTRAGDLDPGVPLYIAHKEHLNLDQVDHLLNKQSGLKGLTGESDMRIIRERAENGDHYAILARDMLAYRIAKYIGSYHAILGPTDALVFTAGLGENDWQLREEITKYLEHIGFKLDKAINKINTTTEISTQDSKIKILVIPTNEELMMARLSYERMQRAEHSDPNSSQSF